MDMNTNTGSCTESLSNECCQFLNILNDDTFNPDNCLVWAQQNDPLVVDDDVDQQNMKYEKSKPPTGGVPYEIKLITLFAVTGVKYYKNCNWRLSTQDNCAGKFDDLVCQSNSGAILVQAKTKSTSCIPENEVISDSPKKTDYNLIAYILSYKNIKIKNIKYLLLCTNTHIKSPLFEISKQEDKQITDIFKRSKLFGVKLDTQTVRKIYRTIRKFKKNIKPDHKKELWKRTMVSKRDIKAFILKFRYIKISEAELGANIEEEINSFNQKVNYIYLLHQIETWYRMERNQEDYLTNLYTHSIFYGEQSRHLTEMYLDPSINFETMHEMYENKIVFVKPGIHYHWSLRRIVQSLRHFDKKPDNLFYNQILFIQENEISYINLFKLKKFKYLIICLPQSTNDQVKNACQILETIMGGNSKKLAFFVANETSYSNNNVLTSIEDKISLSWFNSDSRDVLLNREIVFQFPKKTLKLRELLNYAQDLEKHIDEQILTRLRDLNTFHIGRYVKSLENIKYCHISRSLKSATGLPVSNYDFDAFDKRVFVLVGPPGSGKSTYLIKVAHLKKERSPQTWIIHLDIASVVKFLEANEGEPLMNLFYQLEGTESNFEQELMNSLEKYVLIDGFIELNTTYLIYFKKMITLLLKVNSISKIFIALRDNHISMQALKAVKEVEILIINPFSEDDQQTYFNMAIQSIKDKSSFHKFVETFTKLNHLMSNPLYMSLMFEIFVESEKQTSIILTRENVYEIYNYFLKIKKRVFALEYSEENSVLCSILDDTFERYLNDMRLIAVKNIFANTDCEKFFELISIHDFVLRIGIIEKSYDEYIFRHKTFEEYLSAEYIWKLVCTKSKKILSELLDIIFFNFEYAGTCSFFDDILQIASKDNLTKISEVYNEIFSEPERIERTNITYLAQQGNINTLKLFLTKSKDCSKILSKTYSNGRTVLHYSATYPKLIEFLAEKGADINALDDKGYGICHYAMSSYLSEMYNKSMTTKDVHALVRYLMIERDDFLVDIVDEFGNTLLHYFCMDNQLLEIVQFLCSENTSLCTAQNLFGNTPLHFAAHNDAHEIIHYFVEHMNIDILRVKNLKGDSLIHSASSGNAVNVLDYINESHEVIFKDLIDLENDNKHTALDHAFLNCAYEAIQYLEGNYAKHGTT
ncbi:uncharacterized protein LOC126889601 [Diabrotica virgifera virgifera]|uniref:Uncharacterized protein n=1 Tax=Diabrotica virgifera virgifera TaxID=50390 RepID=A0ABM5KV17_DIAVI|nr:uncharacterized protein LOC126889601 [Diabrotica virgifera virgifera]